MLDPLMMSDIVKSEKKYARNVPVKTPQLTEEMIPAVAKAGEQSHRLVDWAAAAGVCSRLMWQWRKQGAREKTPIGTAPGTVRIDGRPGFVLVAGC